MSDIKIHVHVSDDPYTRIRNSVLQDHRLSFQARGVLAYLFSKPADWVPRMYDIRKAGGIGEKAQRSIMRELRENGYAWLEKIPEGSIYHVTDIPQDPPACKGRVPLGQGAETGGYTNKRESTNERKNTNKRDSTGMDLEIDKTENGMSEMIDELDADDFGMWWAAYPRQVNEKNARTAYYAASKKVDRATLLRAAEGYAKEVRGRAKEYITLPARFLTDEMWQDYDLSKREEYTMYNGEVRQLTSTEAETAKEWIYKKGRVK